VGSFLLQELVRGLDERPLRRLTSDWGGFFEGVVDVAGVRTVENAVLFTLSLPTAPNDVNDFIHVEDIERNTTDKIRLRQSDADLPSRVVGVLRTGPDPRWMPGPDAYHFRIEMNGVTTPLQTPLVLQLLDDSDPPEVLAEATGAAPYRDDINDILTSSVITRPLLEQLRHATLDEEFDVVIDVNLKAADRREAALAHVRELVNTVTAGRPMRDRGTEQYVFERLTKAEIEELVRVDASSSDEKLRGSIHRVWPDFQVHALIDRSISTIKADAARAAFSAAGRGIRWAVVDSGIDARHSHFDRHKNLELTDPNVTHRNFLNGKSGDDALGDDFGHGTHVAGILAGEQAADQEAFALVRARKETGDETTTRKPVTALRGVAPECEIVSLRVLDGDGNGAVTAIMEALDYVNAVNMHGRNLRIHGVNLSVGYEFNAEWFACGQSPLCVEVDRLVRSGVVVVVAAGNTGYGQIRAKERPTATAGLDLTINDPGNADRAITVGSTHASEPHTFGVSFFSSKGPTGDGRNKPDLVAPGERIVSCAAGNSAREQAKGEDLRALYLERSGTSMAAPHVSGAIAAFLSIRSEFVGQPERVKELLVGSATDLGRNPFFQGSGLLDLMRAIQAV
jgi:subtilisin family serine protease